MTTASIHDNRICHLGEGPLWHPERQQLFWFDILSKRLLSQDSAGEPLSWAFDEFVSAAGWVSASEMLIASETSLSLFNLETSAREKVCDLEAANPITRSNDGRADPWGGLWIGTMGKNAEAEAGAIYRYYRGELRQLYSPITISNAICFAPDRSCAYFADTRKDKIWRQSLAEADGWPVGEPTVFIDCSAPEYHPDGAVVDASGRIWCAQWGRARVACFDVTGVEIQSIRATADQVSCPAFGGPNLDQLFATSATQGMSEEAMAARPDSGKTFTADPGCVGQAEHQVIL